MKGRPDGETGGRIDPLLEAAGLSLRASSGAIRAAVDHRGEIGRGHEEILAMELRKVLPSRVHVRTGSIIGARGTISRQLDLVLCDLQNYPAFSYGAAALLVPDSVLGVISVKTRLRPSDLPTYFTEAADLKALMREVLGTEWTGFYAVIGYWLDGTAEHLTDAYHDGVSSKAEKRTGVDLIGALDGGPLCIDLATFCENPGEPPRFLAARAHVPGIAFDACIIESPEPFVDLYKLIIRRIDAPRLSRIVELAAPPPGLALPEGVSADPAYRAAFAGKSADLRITRGMLGIFQMFYANTGSASWVRGTPNEVRLVVAGPRDYSPPDGWGPGWISQNTYSAQFQDQVGPGELVALNIEVVVPKDAPPGHYRFYARPAIAGVGALTAETRANTVEVVPVLQ